MATAALHHPRTDTVPHPHLNVYPRPITISQLDFSEARYQSLAPTPTTQPTNRHTSAFLYPSLSPVPWGDAPETQQSIVNNNGDSSNNNNDSEQQTQWVDGKENQDGDRPELFGVDAGSHPQQQQQQQPSPQFSDPASHALPPGAAQSLMGRFSFDENMALVPLSITESQPQRPVVLESNVQVRQDSPRLPSPPARSSTASTSQDTPTPTPPPWPPASPDPRHLSSLSRTPRPASAGTASTSPTFSLPAPVTPVYNQTPSIPISPKPRAYAQQPVYVTPTPLPAPNPVNPVYSPKPPRLGPPEEICVECAMRDQDMADVDVTSAGVWDRDSDVLYEELVRREHDERASGFVLADPSRPRAVGGRLTETNLKIWLSVNPREPASRQQTLEKYIRSQRKLLEAEVTARARAVHEARQLDSRMKDTYSQLRRSAYDLGTVATPIDDSGGLRIKPPSSPVVSSHLRGHSRDVTLLENGMIVEHVDVRKEEREARERKRKEEKRARKSSRSSGVDVTSLYSIQSLSATMTDGGVGLRPQTLYSPTGSARPSSVLTSPNMPRARSQASFSDVHSLGSSTPRRSRLFGLKNHSTGWRSQDSLAAASGISGSMMDMHVALQREAAAHPRRIGATSLRQSQIWPTRELEVIQQEPDEKPKKKQSGFKKIWRIVTGSSKAEMEDNKPIPSRIHTQHEEDFPLAPPPPLSFLVDRGSVELPATRQGSSPSINSPSIKNSFSSSPCMSPPTAPSSILPSPASSSRPGGDREVMIEGRSIYGAFDNGESADSKVDEIWNPSSVRGVYPNILQSDIRPRVLSSPSLLSNRSGSRTAVPSRPMSIIDREKSLPPLPDEMSMPSFGRPLTVFDTRRGPPTNGFLPPNNGYRGPEVRRQSLGGMVMRTNNLNPNTRSQTALPRTIGYDSGRSLSPRYDEFAFSRRSLGILENVEENPLPRSPTPNAKRKSKFGFASLFGKKSNASNATPDSTSEMSSRGLSTLRMSETYEGPNGNYVNGASADSMGRQAPPSRMSVASRRAVEVLVDQDPEFVAYRYPSNDERLDLLRRNNYLSG